MIPNVEIFNKLLGLMCSLRVESVCLHFVVKKKKIEIVDFWGDGWFTHLS